MVAVTIRFDNDLEQEEAVVFHPGQQVQFKDRPGVVDTIAAYDPMMVPPIWLENDPQPRYPEELRIVKQTALSMGSVRVSANSNVRYVDFWGRFRLISKSS